MFCTSQEFKKKGMDVVLMLHDSCYLAIVILTDNPFFVSQLLIIYLSHHPVFFMTHISVLPILDLNPLMSMIRWPGHTALMQHS